jgi:Icc-related predicted phosphoesterase
VAAIGAGWSSPTPFGTPSEVPAERIGAWLEEALALVPEHEHLLVMPHDPPKDTLADMLPGGRHVGNPFVRAFIERVRPEVCLTGHIHEARSTDDLGPTRIVNPGPLADGGYAFICLSGGRLTAELRTIR